jgi:uncharacterized membrane protein
MTAAFAPPPWSAPSAPAGLRWHFGREVWLHDAAGHRLVTQWRLKRNCSISPAQMGAAYGALCAMSLAVALVFLVQGVPLVLAFAGLELLAVGTALLVFARHAGDHETLTLDGRSLQVELERAGRVRRIEFAADRLTVEPAAGQGSLITLSGQGQLAQIGRFLRPDLRGAFARELRHALRQAASPAPLFVPFPSPGSAPRPGAGPLPEPADPSATQS